MKKIIIIAAIVGIILMFLGISMISGASIMSALFPEDEILNAQYFSALEDFLVILTVALVAIVAYAAYCWLPVFWYCAIAQVCRDDQEAVVYWEGKAANWAKKTRSW